MKTKKLISFIFLMFASLQANAVTVLVSPSTGDNGYGYGFSRWTEFTSALDSASGNNVTVGNLNSLSNMLTYDALMVDQRWTSGMLTASEINNITQFANTGRKVFMVGENSSWTTWNNQILGIGGGSYSGTNSSATTSPIISNSLTAGVGAISLPTAGVANGGTALFNVNWATLFGNNILTMLDVNVFENWTGSNAVFGTNVANWLADSDGGTPPPPPGQVPLPAAVWLFGSAILGFAGFNRFKKKA